MPAAWPEGLAALINLQTRRFKTEIIRSLQTTEAKWRNDGPFRISRKPICLSIKPEGYFATGRLLPFRP